jgi:hypothetical protein
VVFDSLNTEPLPSERVKAYQEFAKLMTSGLRLIIVIADTVASDGSASFWEYHSDLVIRLGRYYGAKGSEYMVRDLEVVKARYQQHKWGRHQLKIYSGREPQSQSDLERLSPDARKIAVAQMRRSHPFRNEGGIFIFPSIHSVLSYYKQVQSPPKVSFLPSGIPGFPEALALGERAYPKGLCTALVGRRGGHKSHLAFHEVLFRITKRSRLDRIKHKGMIVSLRDDESTTRETLIGILASMDTRATRTEEARLKDAAKTLAKLEEGSALEINYFPPGYITPEEFFHRLLLSINRMTAAKDTHLTVVFNSLDQLDSRFPLCAEQRIFIPGIIQMLCGEGVSSFFVGAGNSDEPGTFHGLRSMAELILSFDHDSQSAEGLKACLAKDTSAEAQLRIVERAGDFPREVVKVRVARYAGGKAAGARGLLELVETTRSPFYEYKRKTGLICLPSRKATNPS